MGRNRTLDDTQMSISTLVNLGISSCLAEEDAGVWNSPGKCAEEEVAWKSRCGLKDFRQRKQNRQ